MKNAFEINLTTEEKSCDKFIVKKIPDDLERRLDEMNEAFTMIQKNSSIPIWLTVIYYICAFFAIAVTAGFFEAAVDIGFATAFHNAGWMIYADSVCIVVALAVFIYKWRKKKKTEQSPAVQSKLEESKKLNSHCYEELGVPADADTIDIFSVAGKLKKGKVMPATYYQYTNVACKIYNDSNNLYIADTIAVYRFPLNSFTHIVTRNKNTTFNTWNKDEGFNQGIYKQYKVRRNNFGFFIKPYHSVQFFAFNEEYEIVIPSYELQTLLKYVNLNVTYGN